MPGWIDIKVVSDADDTRHEPAPGPDAGADDGVAIGPGAMAAIVGSIGLIIGIVALVWFLGFRTGGSTATAQLTGPAAPLPASQFSSQPQAGRAGANTSAQEPAVGAAQPAMPVPDSPSADVARRLRSDSVVARVNGEPITEAMVEREVGIARVLYPLSRGIPVGDDPETLRQMRADLLSSLVDERLLVQAAQDAGTTVDDAEVDSRIDDMLSKAGVSETDIADMLAGVGLSLDDLRVSLRSTMLAESFVAESPVPEGMASQSPYSAWVSKLQANADVEILTGSESSAIVKVGQPAPDFTLRDPDGETVRLSDYLGHPIILNFWATWCPPCRYEMPLLQETYDSHQAAGLVVLAVDVQETAEQVKAYREEMNLSFPMALDRGGSVATTYRVSGLPTSVFVDVDGVVRAIHRGALVESTLQGYLDDLLD
jgi:peroxiredoxin